MLLPSHILGAIDAACDSGNFLHPEQTIVECRVPMEGGQEFVSISPISRLADGCALLDAKDLRGGAWELFITEDLHLGNQTECVRTLAEKDSLSRKDEMILDCWLAGVSAKLYGKIGHPGIEMGNLFSPDLKQFIRATKDDPEYVRYETGEIKTGFMREILSLMDRFPDAGIDADEDEKFTLYHGVQFQRTRPDAPVESGVFHRIQTGYPRTATRRFNDTLEDFTPVASLSEKEFTEDPGRGLEKFRIRGAEEEKPSPAM